MKYHKIDSQENAQHIAESLARLPERDFSLCTRFPAEDFMVKRPGADGQRKMDVLALQDQDWFRVEDAYEQIICHKLELIRSCRDLVYAVSPEAGRGAQEAFELASQYLTRKFSHRFGMEDGELVDLHTGRRTGVGEGDSDPLLILASIVDEDLVVMELDNERRYRVSAVCACCPSHWSIHQKLGKTLQEVHEPVPNLNSNIGAQIDQLIDRLPTHRAVSRINMLVNFDPRWSQFPALIDSHPFPHTDLERFSIGDLLYLRNERETITKLPETSAILFTIKTYQVPFRLLPGWACEKLASYHDGFDRGYREGYRKLSDAEHELVVGWLRERASLSL